MITCAFRTMTMLVSYQIELPLKSLEEHEIVTMILICQNKNVLLGLKEYFENA